MKNFWMCFPLVFLATGLHRPHTTHPPLAATPVMVGMGSRGANCSGSGVCSISPPTGGQDYLPAVYRAMLGFDAQGKLFLEFLLSDIPADVYAAQFGSAQFVMQSDCPIPADVLNAVDAPDTTMMLKTGSYLFSANALTVRITF